MAIWSASSVAVNTRSRPGQHGLGQRVGVGQRPQRGAQPAHAGRGPHALAHDVADDQDQPAVGQREHVVPVAAHVGLGRAGPEPGGQLDARAPRAAGRAAGCAAGSPRWTAPARTAGPAPARSRTGRPARPGRRRPASATGSSKSSSSEPMRAAGDRQVDLDPGPRPSATGTGRLVGQDAARRCGAPVAVGAVSATTRRTSATVSASASAAVACWSCSVRSSLRRSAASARRRSVTSETSTATPRTAPSPARAGNHCDW